MLKTENLVILFTDIAGFTESTAFQSREQNQRILDRHNSILLPIVRRFRGRHIKSIGDALLLAYTSPTDAMRCAMAMQDALHEYNQTAPTGEDIHIRIAASLGEVRVTKNDIFGEPVNVTSRIEGITPGDEIYFSEAVYLAMNKAEVPAVEVGLRDLKGISKPVRIFAIPRFAETRLVADGPVPPVAAGRGAFPFGGMHLAAAPLSASWQDRFPVVPRRTIGVGVASITAAALVGWAVFAGDRSKSEKSANEGNGAVRRQMTMDLSPPTSVTLRAPASRAVSPSGNPTAVPLAAAPTSVPRAMPTIAVIPTVAAAPTIALNQESGPTPAATVREASPRTPPPTATLPKSQSASNTKPVKPKPIPITTIIQAKYAYKAGRIDKAAYRQIVERIESEFDAKVRQAKLDYRAGKLTKVGYKERITQLKRRYIGVD